MTTTNTSISEIKQTPRADNITALYLGLTYEDYADNRQWLPMMRISWDNEGYFYHSFTKAFQDNYELVKGNVLNPKRGYTQTWKDKRITGLFDGRIPRRADSMEAYNLYGVGDSKGDFISLFARNGGTRHGDRYDVFPEIKPLAADEYCFWFRVYELPTLIKDGHNQVKTIANNISSGSELELELLTSEAKIYYRGEHIGYCPPYIHFLLTNNPECDYQLYADIVNKEEPCYEDRIIAKLTLIKSQSIFTHRAFQPINPMPV